MTRPFPKLVSDGGKIVREVIPIFNADQLQEVYQMVDTSKATDGKPITGTLLAQRQAEARAAEFEIVNVHVQGIGKKVLADFTRNLDAAGLLDENGMVKR